MKSQQIQVILGDITQLAVDAIVNAANTTLLGGGGVDGSIHRAAGPKLLEECRTMGGCATGEAKLTKGYSLKAKYVIHAVGPIWYGGNNHEEEKLASCYSNSLKLAIETGCVSIAFPNISTGVYSFPKVKAAKIAINAVIDFLNNSDSTIHVIFCCYDKENYQLYLELTNE